MNLGSQFCPKQASWCRKPRAGGDTSEGRPGGAAEGGVSKGTPRPGSVLKTHWSVRRTSEGAGDTVLSLGCTKVLAVSQGKREGPLGSREGPGRVATRMQ